MSSPLSLLASRLVAGPRCRAMMALSIGGSSCLTALTLGLHPALAAGLGLVVMGYLRHPTPTGQGTRFPTDDGADSTGRRNLFLRRLDDWLGEARRKDRATGVIIVEIDRFKLIEERYDHAGVAAILQVTQERLQSVLRDADLVSRLDGPTFAIAIAPVRRIDIEEAVRLSGRLQQAIAPPIDHDGLPVFVTASIGFSLLERMPDASASRLLHCATAAMIEAQRNGPSAVRCYSQAMRDRIITRNSLAAEVTGALERGEILPFFQPQLCARTGEISGVETLARWHHPDRGLIPPAEFLPALHQADAMGLLADRMVNEALKALQHWDARGLDVPRVGVNFSDHELGDPGLVDRINWTLDRMDMSADRLVVEVLETVVANRAEDMVIRNLAGLARLGCSLDLDDFGTGHAAITSIRRFSIRRLKIDRSFVTRIDADPEQQAMVSAILTMADRLGLDTLAEGVETSAEMDMLASLGCQHLQGFVIARPMPLAEADRWICDHRDRRATLARVAALATR